MDLGNDNNTDFHSQEGQEAVEKNNGQIDNKEINENNKSVNNSLNDDLTEEAEDQKSDKDLLTKMQKELAAKCQENDQLQTRFMRLQADFDNFRKRTRQEKEEVIKYSLENLMVEILPVLDNFERALKVQADDSQDVIAGVEMIYKQFYSILEKEGLEKISALEQPFDPNKHDAVMQEENDQYPDNTVIGELQTGYMYNQKVIRPAMVKVSKQ